jgi:hypothetical protein
MVVKAGKGYVQEGWKVRKKYVVEEIRDNW